MLFFNFSAPYCEVTYLLTYIHTYIHTWLLTYIHTHIHTWLLTYIHTYIHTWLLACLPAYILAYILAYLLPHIARYKEIPGVLYLLSYPLKDAGQEYDMPPSRGGSGSYPNLPISQFPPISTKATFPLLFGHPEPPRRQILHIYTLHPSDPIFP